MINFSKSFFLTLFMGIFAYESQLVASQSAIGDRVSPYLCKAVTKKQEFVSGIPRDLLSAISLAETGRWNPKSRTMYPWPWTVTWGGKGRYFANKQEKYFVDTFKLKNKVVDTTGAGDAFNGAFAFALANDYKFKDALEFANKVAAISTTKIGAANSMPKIKEVEKY